MKSLLKSLSNQIRSDIREFNAVINAHKSIDPGLYTYRVSKPDGGKMRIHLRVEGDCAGVLFIDVTDVIHLNPTAVMITKLALDGIGSGVSKLILRKKYGREHESQVVDDLSKIYQMVNHFRNHSGDCFTCDMVDLLETSPIFSIPVKAPYKVDIALTYGCNNQCPHCYNEVNRFPMPSLLLQDWFEVLDKIASLGIPHIILTGGEATLHPNLLEIIQYADKLGMIVGMNTNGRYIAYEPFMRKLAESGLNHIQITLGSCYPGVHNLIMGGNSFSQTVRGIEVAIRSGIHVITNTTLMRSNMDHAEAIIDFLYNLGIRTFAMNGMIYSGGGFSHPNAIPENELAPLLVRVRDYAKNLGMRFLWYTPTEYCRLSPLELEIGIKKCNAGEYSLCIEPNGDVLPCQSYYVSPGNILLDPWEKIWKSELFLSFRDRVKTPQLIGLPEKCWDCLDLSVCGGGCRIEREAREGIRISGVMGGGCIGCSGFIDSRTSENQEIENLIRFEGKIHEGYIPNSSQTKTNQRSSGNLPFMKHGET